MDIEVYGHEAIQSAITHQLSTTHVHHAWFFSGSPGIGKLETALWFAQKYFCEYQHGCGKCPACVQVAHSNHPGLLLFTSSDRLPTLRFFHEVLLQELSSTPEKVITQLRREIDALLVRHRQQLLEFCKREKVSYREGVVLSAEKLETVLHQVHLNYQKSFLKNHLEPVNSTTVPPWLISKAFLEDMRQIQNCLDRSVITRENLEKALNWIKHQAGRKKLLIIENIERIHPTVVGMFLKTLEDPPPDTHFILISEDTGNLNPEVTIPLLSRCLQFNFANLNEQINDILLSRFHIKTGFIHHEATFTQFLSRYLQANSLKNATKGGSGAFELLFKPTHAIHTHIKKDFNCENFVNLLYSELEEYALPKPAESKTGKIKLSANKALTLLKFLEDTYPLTHRNNYNTAYFVLELAELTKKLLKPKNPKKSTF